MRHHEPREVETGPDFIFQPGTSISWKTPELQKQFSAPAFGHGPGPFISEGKGSALGGDTVRFTNAKGDKVQLSVDFFINTPEKQIIKSASN